MVDDSSADRALCRILLEEEYGAELDFVEAPDARRGLELCGALTESTPLSNGPGRLPDRRPDCLLLDYKLPDLSGVEFLRRLGRRVARQGGADSRSESSGDLPQFAVVMLTGLGNEQVAAEAMRAGAQDYLVKDRITSESLRLAIEKATGKVGLLRTLQAERDRLAHLLAEKEALLVEKEALLSEKDALLEEVHHRVKNNLQVIASLLRLQADSFASSGADPRLPAALRDSQNRVESMALIHEQLYQARNLREVDLAEHAGLLSSHLMHAYGVDPARIQCHLHVEKLSVGVDRAIPAALILNELISNALKHAFPAGRTGIIEVFGGRCPTLRPPGNSAPREAASEKIERAIYIEVRDNGAGLASPTGPSQSLGLNIVRILTRQLRGKFEIENRVGAAIEANAAGQDGAGIVCRLTFPEEGEKHAINKILHRAAAATGPAHPVI
jgi:two-component sensor histidine kinase